MNEHTHETLKEWLPFLVALRRGEPLVCTAEEWHTGLRTEVQQYAADMIDKGQDIYAVIALQEVRATDARCGSGLLALAAKEAEDE